jgi:hypothetical protein
LNDAETKVTDGSYSYWGIFWVNASTSSSIQQSFTGLARVFQVEENVDSVKRKLINTSQAWLLVFDNADDPELSLTPYLPAGDPGDIIITSRNPGCHVFQHRGISGGWTTRRPKTSQSRVSNI